MNGPSAEMIKVPEHRAWVLNGVVYGYSPKDGKFEINPHSPKDYDGRYQVMVDKDAGGRVQRLRAHVCWEAYNQRPLPPGMVVDHIDEQRPWADTEDNLKLITQSDNITKSCLGPNVRKAVRVALTHRDGRYHEFDSYAAAGRFLGLDKTNSTSGSNAVHHAVRRGDYAKRSHSVFKDWTAKHI